MVQRLTRTLGMAAFLSMAFAPRVASADLTGDFADALDVDTSYVTGATGATDIAFAADGRAVITRKSGAITIRHTDGTTNVLMGTFMNVDTMSEKGLTGIVAHPGEANTFFFYVDNGPTTTDKHRVYKGVLNADNTLTVDVDNPIVAATRDEGPGLEGPANHDGGGLFIYDNHLYIGVGDTGANATPPTNKYSSCLNKGNGKILRVNLDGTIPDDNPLVGVASVTACDSTRGEWATAAPDERVYAWGLRNPWRFSVDHNTGRMWIGDVGETTREEISVSAPAAGYTGQHFGYPFREGTTSYDMLDGKDCSTGFAPASDCTAPVHDYDNNSVGNCVIGGIIPEGCGWETAFGGKLYYFFSDNGESWLHALEVKPDRSGVVSATAVEAGTFSGGAASIRQGPNGAMYVVFNGAGSVFEFKPKDQTGDDCMSMGGAGGAAGTGAGGAATAGSAGTGTAGTGGGAGTASASGGSGGTGGAGGSAGSAPTAGRAGSTGTGGTSSGGQVGVSGSSAQAGSASGAPGSDEESGCGCRVAGQRTGSLAVTFAMLGLAIGVFGRRRARR